MNVKCKAGLYILLLISYPTPQIFCNNENLIKIIFFDVKYYQSIQAFFFCFFISDWREGTGTGLSTTFQTKVFYLFFGKTGQHFVNKIHKPFNNRQ